MDFVGHSIAEPGPLGLVLKFCTLKPLKLTCIKLLQDARQVKESHKCGNIWRSRRAFVSLNSSGRLESSHLFTSLHIET